MIEENPNWSASPPGGIRVPPPVKTKDHKLPLLGIPWEDFERLCRRLAQTSGKVEQAWCYGSQGYKQLGIDILVLRKDGEYETWQSKRHKKFSAKAISSALEHFSKHKWADKAKRFILAVACDLSDPKAVDEIAKATQMFATKGIEFKVLSDLELGDQLRNQPEIIDDFFGREWVAAVCGADIAGSFSGRLSNFDFQDIRKQLRLFYSAWICPPPAHGSAHL